MYGYVCEYVHVSAQGLCWNRLGTYMDVCMYGLVYVKRCVVGMSDKFVERNKLETHN